MLERTHTPTHIYVYTYPNTDVSDRQTDIHIPYRKASPEFGSECTHTHMQIIRNGCKWK